MTIGCDESRWGTCDDGGGVFLRGRVRVKQVDRGGAQCMSGVPADFCNPPSATGVATTPCNQGLPLPPFLTQST
eukprot:756547-Hanusia_phi.AAC.6